MTNASRTAARSSAAAVGAVVAVGVVLRFVTRSDLWLDEALSVNIARLPIGDIASWLRVHDGAPPLYYWLLHIWTGWFGTGDVAVRSLSGLFGVAALPLAWACGRRIGGQAVAATAVVVLALNPFAIRYATEARMYGLEIVLIFAGILGVRRSLERPTAPRLATVAILAAALVWSQYWCVSLVIAAVLTLLLQAWRGAQAARANAVRVAAALVCGSATFVLWLPAFLEQARHTGTPWAQAELPPGPIGTSVLEFAGGAHAEGWLLVYPAIVLLVIGAFGRARGSAVVELDFRAPSDARGEALAGLLALVIGATLADIGGSGFQPRYSAIALPFFVLVLARGITVFADRRVRAVALVLVCLCGLAGGLRNVRDNRTQTGAVAAAIAAHAQPGDVVAYCPDQLGPATHRLLKRRDLIERTYPFTLRYSGRADLVDWFDYTKRLGSITPAAAARRLLEEAGRHTIFVVTAPGYITHDALCSPFVNALVALGHRRQHLVVSPDPETFERAGLYLLQR